ncbi:MAG: nuclear transport factor 2 family protein [Bacteroidales bacterium]
MKIKFFIITFISIIVFYSCINNYEPGNKNDALVDSLIKVLTDGTNSGDLNKVSEIYADDAVVISMNSRAGGIDSIRKMWEIPSKHAKNFVHYKGVSSVTDDMVYMQGMFTFDWSMDNYNAACKGNMVVVWKKQADGKWKITYEEENHGDLVKK